MTAAAEQCMKCVSAEGVPLLMKICNQVGKAPEIVMRVGPAENVVSKHFTKIG